MNPGATGLAVALGLAAMAAVLAVVTVARCRGRLVGAATAASGTAAAAAGVAALAGHPWQRSLPQLLPMFGLRFAADGLSGWFLLLIGVVTVAAGVYTTGYAGRDGRGPGSRTALCLLPLFCAAMLLVPVAASVATLLLGWELMAVTSLLLVLTEHRHSPAVRVAAMWYAAMTQAGFVALLAGLVWLGAATGSGSFADIRTHAASLSPVVASGVFGLCLVGFASKAGAVPLHPWLPRAHAEAPSNVSALMSAAMVKLGVYGLFRAGFDLLGGGQRWWWLVVAIVGALSALYGIVQAAVATDIKRLLAYSTSENVGLILIGVGFAGLYAHSGQPTVAALAAAAALLHGLNHAAFKTLLFTGAGSVVRATATRNLDRLGGLARRMPATTTLFAVGALMAAALPPGNGFLSEWLLLQSLLHPRGGTLLTVAAPLAVAVVAVTAGVGVATYVKAVGTGFLARPRSDAAASAVEAPSGMRAGMCLAGAACVVLAVVPAITAGGLAQAVAVLRLGPSPVRPGSVGVRLAGMGAAIWPLWVALAIVGGTVVIATVARFTGRPRRRTTAWACGDGPLTARMEYTATSFAEPLQRVFDDVVTPERDVDVSHAGESAYHVEAVRFAQRIPDRIEHRLYEPVVRAVGRMGERARTLASGSVHRYLGYLFAALVAVLLVGVWR